MKAITIVLLICSLLISCFPDRNKKLGTYIQNENYGVGYELDLRPDSSFQFQWQIGLNSGSQSGNWNSSKNSIILTVEENKHQEACFLKSSIKNDQIGIAIKLVNLKGEPLPYASIKVNDGNGVTTNVDGVAFLNNVNDFSISVSYMNIYYPKLTLTSQKGNFFVVCIDDQIKSHFLLDNAIVKFKGKRIKMSGLRWFNQDFTIEKSPPIEMYMEN